MKEREHLGSRLGFILLSAGCAIGCGNVWKFPWMCGQYGGGGFILIYVIFLLVLGLPVLTMEFSMGRAAQVSPFRMYPKLNGGKGNWGLMGWVSVIGNLSLMAFYTVVTGWMIYYFVRYLSGVTEGIGFESMISDPGINVSFTFITVLISFLILSMGVQNGLERITSIMMFILQILLVIMAVKGIMMPGAAEGIRFYLVPDFSKINGDVVVAAMNQAFFTLSVGMGNMSLFGSYIGKERSMMGEAVNVIVLDSLVAVITGFIIFPACFSYGIEVDSGPSLLFNTMASVFEHMENGRIWGCLFFLFMIFAALSSVLSVCENIIAMAVDITGWERKKASAVCGVLVFLLSLTTALGYSVIRFHPFGGESSWLELWDFIVSGNVQPLGSLALSIFCCAGFGWGWDAFFKEANTGKGLKVKRWMKPLFTFVVPVSIIIVYVCGILPFILK